MVNSDYEEEEEEPEEENDNREQKGEAQSTELVGEEDREALPTAIGPVTHH